MRGFLRTCGLAACLVAGLVVGTNRVTAAESESERTLRAGDYAECASHGAQFHAGGDSAMRKAAMTDEIAAYQSLAEEALSMRAQAIALYHELREKQRSGEPFSGNDLLRLNSGAVAMLAQREKLLALSVAHEC